MTSDEIKELIKKELKSEKDIRNVFGLNLTERLIEPTIQKYWDWAKKKTLEIINK